jgi:putative phosphoesterase
MRRVAVLSDVHGNLPALDAVLAEVDADAIVCCGDVALGGLPAETLARMRDAGAHFVRGNCDRDPGDWVREQLSEEEVAFLAGLPLTFELDVDGLGRVLFCHATPSSDEAIFTRLTPDDALAEILAGVEADVVVCGHTHVQFDRTVDRWRVVNAGSVGMPYEGKPGAFWLLLGPDVDHRVTDYDTAAAADTIEETGHPSAAQFADYLREHRDPEETSRYFESARAS